jgi:hypothetical protein
MEKDLCYNVNTSIVCAWKDANSTWGGKETDGNPLKVATVTLTQEEINCLTDNGLVISDSQEANCIIVNDVNNPTSISKV